jgi:hypothetical protein
VKPVDYMGWGHWLGPKPLTPELLGHLARVVDGRQGDPLLELPTGREGEALILQEWPECWDVWIYQEPSDLPGLPGCNHCGSTQQDVGSRTIQAAARRIIEAFDAPPPLFDDV